MKRLLPLLALAALIAACDAGVSDPPPEPVWYAVTIAGASGDGLGAALLSVDAPVEQVVVSGGWGPLVSDADGAVVAAVLTVARTNITVELEIATGEVPSIQLLQVAAPDNTLYPSPDAFTVEVREREDGT